MGLKNIVRMLLRAPNCVECHDSIDEAAMSYDSVSGKLYHNRCAMQLMILDKRFPILAYRKPIHSHAVRNIGQLEARIYLSLGKAKQGTELEGNYDKNEAYDNESPQTYAVPKGEFYE